MKNIKKILAVYMIIAAIAVLFKMGDIYASNLSADYPNQICTDFSQDLILGDTDNTKNGDITKLQRFLINRGFSIETDTLGVFSYGTQNAINRFQVVNNVLPTGFVGENTRNVIKYVSCVSNTNYNTLPVTIEVSNLPSINCGVNTGWIWNGRECVNTCDVNHPWDPTSQKCSTGNSYIYGAYNIVYPEYKPIVKVDTVTNSLDYICKNYGSEFYWDGISCSNVKKKIQVIERVQDKVYYVGNNNSQNYQTNTYISNKTPNIEIIYVSNNLNDSTNLSNIANCSSYGYDFVYNGRYCVRLSNINYCGTDNQYIWNGNQCIKSKTTKHLCTLNGKYYENKNDCPSTSYNNSNILNRVGYNPVLCDKDLKNYINIGNINNTASKLSCDNTWYR